HVDQDAAAPFRRALVDAVEDVDEGVAGFPADLQDGVVRHEAAAGQQRTAQGQYGPDDGHDKEADHHIVAFDAVVRQAEESEQQQDADRVFHKDSSFATGSSGTSVLVKVRNGREKHGGEGAQEFVPAAVAVQAGFLGGLGAALGGVRVADG